MKYHVARVKHDPPHSYGDCLRTSLACLLDMDGPEQVPHFYEDGCSADVGTERLTEWLKSIGYMPFFIATETKDEITQFMSMQNPEIHYLLFGSTHHADHVVICRGEDIVHNTAWFGGQLIGATSSGYWLAMLVVPRVLG